MLPRSTHTRSGRNPGGRGQEIQRLIGRALRAAVDMKKLGPRQITVDCDVIQADGGTRTAAVTGGWVALALAMRRLGKTHGVPADALRLAVAAVSTGIVDGQPRLDLAYVEDSAADTDFNFVITDSGRFVEIQGTAETDAVLARGLRAAGRPGAEGGARAVRPAAGRAGPGRDDGMTAASPVTVVLATRNRHKVGEIAALLADCPPPGGHRRGGRRPGPDRGRDTFEGNALPRPSRRRPPPACPRWPTIRGWRSTPWAAPPACTPRATPASPATTPATTTSCCARWPASPPRSAAPVTAASPPSSIPAVVPAGPPRQLRGPDPATPRGAGGFGYDPLFLIPALGKTMAEIDLREKPAVPPGGGLPGPGGGPAGRNGSAPFAGRSNMGKSCRGLAS